MPEKVVARGEFSEALECVRLLREENRELRAALSSPVEGGVSCSRNCHNTISYPEKVLST